MDKFTMLQTGRIASIYHPIDSEVHEAKATK